MEPRHRSELSNRERRRRERPVWRRALVASLVVHAVLLGWLPVPSVLVSPEAAAGPRAGDARAAAGGMQTVTLRVPPSRPVVPPRIPLPALTEIEPVTFEEVVLEPASIAGEAPGPAVGPGLERGDGRGDGGTGAEGRFRLEAPVPRSIMFPNPPDDDRVRGREVEVWVFVDAGGRVVADSTRLRPPTPNGDFNRRLLRDASEWSFSPALRDGRAVSSWFNYRLTLGGG
ncbi:MAG: hypothetical protein RQ751_12295 [Longimicrobiales bacterium]|nr:hypothetical protein [Longimicrobiales bacterium]